MKTILAAVLASVLGIAIVSGEESPKLKVATVRLDRIHSHGLNIENLQLLAMDKATLESYKKIDAEIQIIYHNIADAEDELKLTELGRKMEFLNRKLSMIRQRMGNRPQRDNQLQFRDFVIGQYKDKYQLIFQDTGMPDRILWKGNVEYIDITDEAVQKFRERLDRLIVDEGREGDGKSDGKNTAFKIVVATVQVDRILNSGMNYEKIRILSADKNTLEALNKVNVEIQSIKKAIVDVEDEEKLEELGKKLNFLIKKSNLLYMRNSSNPREDMQSLVRGFVIDNFKDKYPLILWQYSKESMAVSILWKANVEFVDITDDVAEKFKAYLDQIPDQSNRVHVRNMMHTPNVPLIKQYAKPPEAKDVPKAKEATKAKDD